MPMSTGQNGKKRLNLRQSDKVILCVLCVLIVLLIALNILQRCGLTLVNGLPTLYLPLAALAVLIGWGGYALVRRIRHRGVRIAVGTVLLLALLVVGLLAFTYIGFIAAITQPQRYTVVQSPSGAHTLVVMRTLESEDARMQQRADARLSLNPNDDPGITAQDWGYEYRAYPMALRGLFYRSDADVEGEVHLAYRESGDAQAEEGDGDTGLPHGTLMVEWLDDEATAHFFVQDPGVAEGGDCYVRF